MKGNIGYGYAVGMATLVVSLLAIAGFTAPVFSLVLLAGLLFYLVDNENLVHQMWMIGYWSFSVMPIIHVGHFVGLSPSDYFGFAISSILTVWALRLTRMFKIALSEGEGAPSIGVHLALSGLCVIDFLVFSGEYFFYYAPAIIIFSVSSMRRGDHFRNMATYFFVVVLVSVYIVFYWGGFGRLIIAGWLIIPTIYFLSAFNFRVKSWIAAPAVALVAYALQATRSVKDIGVERAAGTAGDITSVTSPHVLSVELLDRALSLRDLDFFGLMNQFILLVIQILPRDLWEKKPYGFGYDYTLRELSAKLAEAGHSVAALFWGEHIYYAGFLGLLLVPLSIYLIYLFTRILYARFPMRKYYLASVMWIPTFYWGGMAAYSARFLTGMIFLGGIIFVSEFLFKVGKRK